MYDVLDSLLDPQRIIILLIAVAVFATILTVAAPLVEGDKLRGRLKLVAGERERLRAQHKASLQSETRLREKSRGLAPQIVEALNLRKLFQAETSREKLRQAGLRSERHLMIYLTIRLLTPLVSGLAVFVYTAAFYSDAIPPQMRLAAVFLGIIAGIYFPGLMISNLITRRQKSIRLAWSDALDLLLICVESGMGIEPALQRVSREIGSQSVPLAEELTLTHAELSYLPDRRKAFENLAKRTGLPTVKSVVASLIQSERYGTPLGQALRVLAQENRDARMQEAERKAAALPPKLTVPMILFFLPVIFIIILGPSAILVLEMRK
jgi:tight adherence protein C